MKQPCSFRTGEPPYFVVDSTPGMASPTALTISKGSRVAAGARRDLTGRHSSRRRRRTSKSTSSISRVASCFTSGAVRAAGAQALQAGDYARPGVRARLDRIGRRPHRAWPLWLRARGANDAAGQGSTRRLSTQRGWSGKIRFPQGFLRRCIRSRSPSPAGRMRRSTTG